MLFSLNGNGQTDPIIFTDPTERQRVLHQRLARRANIGKDLRTWRIFVLTTKTGSRCCCKNVADVETECRTGEDRTQILPARRPHHRQPGRIAIWGPSRRIWRRRFAELQLPARASAFGLPGRSSSSGRPLRGSSLRQMLALILVYMVMAAQFKSLIDPFIIMFSVPMGIPGVILMLFLTNTTLSTTSLMGIIMMLGIVVSNGVLLVDYTNVLRRRGVPLREAVVPAHAPAASHPDDLAGHGGGTFSMVMGGGRIKKKPMHSAHRRDRGGAWQQADHVAWYQPCI